MFKTTGKNKRGLYTNVILCICHAHTDTHTRTRMYCMHTHTHTHSDGDVDEEIQETLEKNPLLLCSEDNLDNGLLGEGSEEVPQVVLR